MVTPRLSQARSGAGLDGPTLPINTVTPPGSGPAANLQQSANPPTRKGATQRKPPDPKPVFTCPALAAGQKASGNCTWYQPNDPHAVNIQGTTYDRANDSLGLLMDYSESKLLTLKELLKNSEHQAIKDSLGDAFCPEDASQAKECVGRYERFILLEFNRINNSIAQNDTSNAALRSNGFDPNTKAPRGQDIPIAVARREEKPELPYIPSFKELSEMHKAESDRMRASIVNDFENWLQKDYAKAPSCDDFPKFNEIPRNPDSKSEGTFLVVVKDAKGNIVCDKKNPAYLAAQRAYEHAHREKRGLEEDKAVLLNAFKDKTARDALKSKFTKGGLDDANPEQKLNNLIFKLTRDSRINSLNKNLSAKQKKGAKDASRATAATKKPQSDGNAELKPGSFKDHFILINGSDKVAGETAKQMLESEAIGDKKVGDASSIGNPPPAVELPPGD